MRWICAQQFFRAAGYIFFATWFPTYLQKTRGVTLEQSGYLTALTLLGVVAGSLTGGVLSDWVYSRTGSLVASRKGLAIVGLTGSALLLALAFFIDDALTASAVIACASFSAGAAGPPSYSMTMDLSGPHVSMAFGLMNMSGNIGAALSPKCVSWLVVVSNQNWNFVLLLFVGIYAACALCWVMLDPRRSSAQLNANSRI